MPVAGLGAVGLLQVPLTAFFASRRCPGTAIRSAIDWAVQQARERCAVIGGFHSLLEQSVLRLLLEAGSPAVVVLARPAVGASIKSAWHDALDAGTLAIISRSASTVRLTEKASLDRNDLAARLANRIVIGHASHDGTLARQCTRWLTDGRLFRHVDDAGGPRP